ncbi:hypothetical protein KKC1_11440 [Calderihabitans maritimus]|uniref:Uncharacterized protein n=1 Tax=Calderihabitans maritimus TaxID=1246530 RepID=A0A1Z5HR49_9FIRM|nr:hypothetical protein KKC1_11440 [Calderihabitans maritimus]
MWSGDLIGGKWVLVTVRSPAIKVRKGKKPVFLPA